MTNYHHDFYKTSCKFSIIADLLLIRFKSIDFTIELMSHVTNDLNDEFKQFKHRTKEIDLNQVSDGRRSLVHRKELASFKSYT